MATQWPLVYNRLLTLLPTLTGWAGVKVIDGEPVDDNTGSLYCTVGFVDVPGQVVSGGSFSTQRDQSGGFTLETGEVKLELIAQDQQNNLPAARAKVFPLADALQEAMQADYRLGVLAPQATSSLTSEVTQTQGVSPVVSIIFTFSYSTIT